MRTVATSLLFTVLSTSAALGQRTPSALESLAEDRDPEAIARSLIDEYYEALWADDRRNTPVARWPEQECQGTSLSRCFGGDMDCAWWGAMCDATSYALERAELLAQLGALHEVDPTNDFVSGQLVSFAIKDGDPGRAIQAASRCAGTRWWCQALRGYARHTLTPGSGQVHFDSAAVNARPGTLIFGREPVPGVRDRGLKCEWSDAGFLLAESPPSGSEPCAEPAAQNERFWWLSDPLWSEAGNARHSEHIARLVAVRLMYDRGWQDSSDDYWWQSHNVQEEWVRNGFYNSWRKSVRFRAGQPDTTHTLYVDGGYSFTPDKERLADPMASTSADWAVEWNHGPERMITADEWHSITREQTSVLRRGDSLLVVAAARLPVLATSLEAVRGSLVVGRPTDRAVRAQPADVSSTGVLRGSIRVEASDWIASIEAQGPGWVGRARFGAPAPVLDDGFGISRPALVSTELVSDRLSLADAILPSATVQPTGVGVYVEAYGVEDGETMEVRMALETTERGFLGRLGGLFGLGSDAAVEISWSETVSLANEPYAPLFVVVDMSGLADGEYTLSIRIDVDPERRASTSRPVRLESGLR